MKEMWAWIIPEQLYQYSSRFPRDELWPGFIRRLASASQPIQQLFSGGDVVCQRRRIARYRQGASGDERRARGHESAVWLRAASRVRA